MRSPVPVLLLLGVVGGCAAAVPGYVPPTPQREKMLAAAPKGGGIDAQGNYQLSEQEQKLDCKQLTGSIKVKILQMRQAGARIQPSTAAVIAQHASRPLQGNSTYGANLATDLAHDRARLMALNNRLAEKGCRTFDLDAELKPGNTAEPQPVGEPRARGKPSG